MYKQLYQFYTQNHRYRFVSVKIPAACGERPSNRCPVLPPSAFVKPWPRSCLWKRGDKGDSRRTNSGIATQRHYQTDACMILGPYSPQPHNLACFHTMAASILALHWQHSGLLPWGHLVYIQTDWASRTIALSSDALSAAPIWPRFPWQVSFPWRGSLIWMSGLLLRFR